MTRPSPPACALLLGMALSSLACRAPEAPSVQDEPAEVDTTTAASQAGWIYERTFVFTTLDADSATLAPWFFRTRTRPGTVERSSRGWLTRGEEWEVVTEDRWETPPSRAPWRILPHENLGLVVGVGDAVETLFFQEGPRALELSLGDVRMEWTAASGEVFRLLDGSLALAEQELPGMVLDMARTTRADGAPPGDWAFLVSGDSLQLVLEAPRSGDTPAEDPVRAWVRLDFRDLRWSGITVDWAEVRAYPAARRDIPVAWEATEPQGELRASLAAADTWVQALEGPGPLLPVEALFAITGTVSVEGRTFPVRGLLRHVRP